MVNGAPRESIGCYTGLGQRLLVVKSQYTSPGRYNNEEYEAQICPRFNSEHIHVNLGVNLTVLNPDFTGVILKSESDC